MLQSKRLRDIALQIHGFHEIYIKVHLQAFGLNVLKTLHFSLQNEVLIVTNTLVMN